MELVLSLFPGLDLLGRAFTAAGYCVVKGPDALWSELIENFHVPPGRFDGIVGGPPCQNYSDANRDRKPQLGDDLLRHFLRTIAESRCRWFLIENVRNVPNVKIAGYTVQRLDVIDTDFGGKQRRLRHIQFGHIDGNIIRLPRTESTRPVTPHRAILTRPTNPGERHCRRLRTQGNQTISLAPFKRWAAYLLVGNAVAYNTACALAAAVSQSSPPAIDDCKCNCGRRVKGNAIYATAACRQRAHRGKSQPTRAVTWPEDLSHQSPTV